LPISRVISCAYCSFFLQQDFAAAIQHLGAFRSRRQTPSDECLFRGCDGVVDVGRVRCLENADDVIVVCGISIFECLAAVRGDEFAANQVAIGLVCHE
jgi:hypothetical protein